MNNDILRFNVSMEHMLAMQILHTLTYLIDNLFYLTLCHSSSLFGLKDFH